MVILAQKQSTDLELDGLRWQAVLSRDRRFEAAFVYAVHSTGIYCRSSCPSRRPKREHVVFFAGADTATHAGFRPCRRCRPEQRLPVDQQLELVRSVCQHIQASEDGPPTLVELGVLSGISPAHLQHVFKRVLGVTPRQFADAYRQKRFKARLREGWGIVEAIYDAGYGSSSRLYEGVAGHLGMSPASYRRSGKGTRIAFSTVSCPLGRLLLAATSRGVCAVKIGASDSELESQLGEEFPEAEVGRDDSSLGKWLGTLLEHLRGDQSNLNEPLDLPLDVRATAFQRLVWEHLRSIPYGETRTYQEVAQELGRPNSARAVAGACGANPVALVVPCHRVVRRDGGLGGYRWGIQRKEALLAGERSRKPDARPSG